MALNNRDRVGKALDLLAEGLYDIVDEAMTEAKGSEWNIIWAEESSQKHGTSFKPLEKTDLQVQLRALTEQSWIFKDRLPSSFRGFASELREVRNGWAHSSQFSSDDAIRALDTTERLLTAVGAGHSSNDVHKLKVDLQRSVFEEQARFQNKRASITLNPIDGLKPWREVIRPHNDVARGAFTASEFAADLHLVHTGEATSPEYGDPVEFFSRTYLTDGLRDLLSRAIRRIGGDGGASPVVNLQTNFGGGKTHSMLALYHMFSGTPLQQFPQEIQELVAETGVTDVTSKEVKRVALVGTYLKAGSPLVKGDGTEVHTLWGELAWQLGGREAYDIVAKDDKSGTNPGEALRTLLLKYSPALILIDEWVAYARQLVTDKELGAGSFETQFTFAQSLTEVVRSVPGTMLVVSIPASDTAASGHGNDIEIGGAHGQMALERLQNVIRRVADQWRPSSKDESFEIVRRRLFQTPDAGGLTAITTTARAFVSMYRADSTLFPRDVSDSSNAYEMRIRASYPLHPELLDRLYEDWSTLERFQRTRGVLKLVSSIVHELWASNDTSALILPGTVPLDATTVNTDLTQYLEDQWKPIIDSDIDGPQSTAHEIDIARPALGQRFVTQRVARTIFIGAAPRLKSTRKGLDKQYLLLGAAVPGDALGNFGLAVEQMTARSTYFYEEQGHYWFDTQPSVAKKARDLAERLREDVDAVWNEITRRLKSEERSRGLFDRVHVAPTSSADIPDLEDVRLVIVHPQFAHRKQDNADSATLKWINDALTHKGTAQRVHRNTLVFLVADKGTLEGLEEATRSFLAWKTIQGSSDSLNLSPQQKNQTDGQVSRLEQIVNDRLQDTYTWAVYPEQLDASQAFGLEVTKISTSGSKSLADRVGSRLDRDGQLISELGAAPLGYTINEQLTALWQSAGEVRVGELWGFFTQYPYMPRLVSREVLNSAIEQAMSALVRPGENEFFAVAAGKDEETGKYRSLIVPPSAESSLQIMDETLLVEYSRAIRQEQETAVAAENPPSITTDDHSGDGSRQYDAAASGAPAEPWAVRGPEEPNVQAALTRYFGSISVDPERYNRDFGNIAREIIDRLAGAGVELEITLDIQAKKPAGFSESEIRTISENSNVLKFKDSTFES